MTRYSQDDVRKILSRYRRESLETLDYRFAHGTLPTWEAIRGDTAGAFLAPNPPNPWWLRLAWWWLFQRWTGKVLRAPHGGVDCLGHGWNQFRSRWSPVRYPFETYVSYPKMPINTPEPSHCLVLDYRAYRGMMYGLVDDVLCVEPGIFLGRMYWMPLDGQFVGYFILVALEEHP
jgi:hypothetical protein